MNTSPRLQFCAKLPEPKAWQRRLRASRVILIYDQKLLAFPATAAWISGFEHGCAVAAGEELKSLAAVQSSAPQLLRMMQGYSRQETVIVAMGGGSVGDFAGFMASTLKRGVRLVHVPTTWLAAMDSAHGGKTAVNVGEFKNQLGTFYPAERIFICREVLDQQGESECRSAMGELVKMALLGGGPLISKLEKAKATNANLLWQLLPLAIRAKYAVVRKDPYELKNLRHVLNLGHTLGHAYELTALWPHGVAVLAGTQFALRWSVQRRLLTTKIAQHLESLLDRFAQNVFADSTWAKPMLTPSRLRELLLHDKKALRGHEVRFVFLRGPGRPHVEKVNVDDIVAEAARQGVV